MPAPKRSLDIESALRWAYRDELPKREGTPVGSATPRRPLPAGSRFDGQSLTQMMLSLGANRYGVVPDLAASGEAHPDAVAIGRAVEALDGLVIGLPEGWRPLAEMDDLSPEVSRLIEVEVDRISADMADRTRLLGVKTSALVRRHALAGDAPRWSAEAPTVKFETTPNGQPRWFVRRLNWSTTADGREVSHEVEENGYNARSKRPYGDAYRKVFLDPDPAPAILGRAEYEVWHAALDVLASELAPQLASIRLSPTRRPARPWLDGDLAPSVLPDLADMGPLVPLPARRPVAALPGWRPPSTPRHGATTACAAR